MSIEPVSLCIVQYLTRVTERTILARNLANLLHRIKGPAARGACATNYGTGPESCCNIFLIRNALEHVVNSTGVLEWPVREFWDRVRSCARDRSREV